MLYKPQQIEKMWDTWMYRHEGTYYLYYLVTERSPGEGICLATSTDGVHWQEYGMILPEAPDAQWLGTGSVWKSSTFDQDGTFVMNFSEWRGPSMREGQQTIFFATSTDLIHWERLSNDYEFVPDPQWYRVNEGNTSRWDCIYTVPRPSGGLYGYWTGNPAAFHPGFGFGETINGTHWRALPPPEIHWGDVPPMVNMEVGAIEPFGDRYYAMLGSYSTYHDHSMGMFTFVADRPEGPFTPADVNYALLASPEKLRVSYFSRFFPHGDDILVNHQVMTLSDQRYFAPLKQAVVDASGVLRLKYWDGNDVLKGERAALSSSAGSAGLSLLDTSINARAGLILEGSATGLAADPQAALAGLYFEDTPDEGVAVLFGSGWQVDFGHLRINDLHFEADDHVDRALTPSGAAQFRLLVRHTLIELYLNDVLIQCFSLPDTISGRIGVLSASGTTVTIQSIYKMTL